MSSGRDRISRATTGSTSGASTVAATMMTRLSEPSRPISTDNAGDDMIGGAAAISTSAAARPGGAPVSHRTPAMAAGEISSSHPTTPAMATGRRA